MHVTRRRLLAAGVGLAGLAAPALRAQEAWPTRPVRLVVAFSPGGGADRIARLIQPRLSEFLGQAVLVENRGGAGGALALNAVAGAPADGHTLLFDDMSFLVSPLLKASGAKATGRFLPLGAVADVPLVLATASATGIQDLDAYLAAARLAQHPVVYGSPGIGSIGHVAGALLARRSGLAFDHAPYRGGAGLARDLAAGRLPSAYLGITSLLPLVEAGRARALAISQAGAAGLLGPVPDFRAAGLHGFDLMNWHAVFARAGTPEYTRHTLEAALAHAADDAATRRILAGFGAELLAPGPRAFAARLAQDTSMLRELVREAGLAGDARG
jgi:tripartite-type tricarboxylate transporter receptor subunit TctC